jgi:CHASE2 domain-containing sensor protein
MTNELWLMFGIFVVGFASLIGFFVTKTKGFGRFATSTFLILVSLIVSSLMFSAGKLDGQIMANIFFAVIGFAGGLFTANEQKSTSANTENDKV